MVRIESREFNLAQLNNIEKLNGDYFLKTIQANSNGDFLAPFVPVNYDEIEMTYVPSGNGVGEIQTVTYKLDSATIATLTLSYNGDNKLSGVAKS